jgi:hypothetical protein
LPLDEILWCCGGTLEDTQRNPLPIAILGMMKIVPPIQSSEAPEKPCLMRVMVGTKFGELSLTIWCNERMKAGS